MFIEKFMAINQFMLRCYDSNWRWALISQSLFQTWSKGGSRLVQLWSACADLLAPWMRAVPSADRWPGSSVLPHISGCLWLRSWWQMRPSFVVLCWAAHCRAARKLKSLCRICHLWAAKKHHLRSFWQAAVSLGGSWSYQLFFHLHSWHGEWFLRCQSHRAWVSVHAMFSSCERPQGRFRRALYVSGADPVRCLGAIWRTCELQLLSSVWCRDQESTLVDLNLVAGWCSRCHYLLWRCPKLWRRPTRRTSAKLWSH